MQTERNKDCRVWMQSDERSEQYIISFIYTSVGIRNGLFFTLDPRWDESGCQYMDIMSYPGLALCEHDPWLSYIQVTDTYKW